MVPPNGLEEFPPPRVEANLCPYFIIYHYAFFYVENIWHTLLTYVIRNYLFYSTTMMIHISFIKKKKMMIYISWHMTWVWIIFHVYVSLLRNISKYTIKFWLSAFEKWQNNLTILSSHFLSFATETTVLD